MSNKVLRMKVEPNTMYYNWQDRLWSIKNYDCFYASKLPLMDAESFSSIISITKTNFLRVNKLRGENLDLFFQTKILGVVICGKIRL